MQFVRSGPDIPDSLLQAHEDGRVVFFCGAGISYAAGLPSFSGLVDAIYLNLGMTPDAVQTSAIKASQFDTAIGLLEAGIVNGRETVRQALAHILKPDLSATGATSTHEALLTLGKRRDGRMRLITTNFDHLFEEVISAKKLTVRTFQAPLLPVPKNRLDGLIYLHGTLSRAPTASELDQLVVSSGDFGRAYLTERWAARFVSELFRAYTVCFVGYSINDPVLRYMMDALAADRLLGESPPEMFAFGNFVKGAKDARANEWRAKNVTPILYAEHKSHFYLRETLRVWSETYRDGIRGKERIVVEYAMTRPFASTAQDDFVGRMLWAVSDPQGLPAKLFAEYDPVPSFDWFESFCDERFRHRDLIRFGVTPSALADDKLAYSIVQRPAPYQLAPQMAMFTSGIGRSQWDAVMRHLARWLSRHLNDPKLILWLAKRGGRLHHELAWWVEHRLDEISKLERDSNTEKLDNIRRSAPNAIPQPMMRVLWRLLLTSRVKTQISSFDLFQWQDRFRRDALTPTLRFELREMLMPCVTIREPFRWDGDIEDTAEAKRLQDIVDCDVVLSADHVHSTLRDLPANSSWATVLPELLSDFTSLLRDTLDLMRELGSADDISDLSYIHQPSISTHEQNKGFHEWTALIELTRDAWLATTLTLPVRARLTAEQWWDIPYPLFKRLAYFAATQADIIPHRMALDWLLADSNWWLWSVATEREALRLLVSLAPRLEASELPGLEDAILVGPPRNMFKDDIEPARWSVIVEREIWLRLAKVKSGGAKLGFAATARLNKLSNDHPLWQLAADERDEFPYWLGDGDEGRKFNAAPHRRAELVDWLKKFPASDHWLEDDWRQLCRDRFRLSAWALYKLSTEGKWPADRWREALQAWSEERLLKSSWCYMAVIVVKAPSDLIFALANGLSWWLQAIAKTFEGNEAEFLELCHRIIGMDFEVETDTDDPVSRAINHPVGHVTEALLRWWYRRSPEDGQGLPEPIKNAFTALCDPRIRKFVHGRVVLARHAISLFRVDQEWTTQNLLPLFDWSHSALDARAAWEGLLGSPRLYRPFIDAIKAPFLDTAQHYEKLGGYGSQYAALLTFAALDPGDTFTITELATTTRALPEEGLGDVAQTLVRVMEVSKEQSAESWENRVAPYIQRVWPKSLIQDKSPFAGNLARLCVAAHDAFPAAFKLLKPWLVPFEHPGYVVRRLRDSGICSRFPIESLGFLDLTIDRNPQWFLSELEECLNMIRAADSRLVKDQQFTRLDAIARRA